MARFLHITPDSTPTGGKQHQKQVKSNAPGILSKAPIQGLSATQHLQNPFVQRAQAGPWFLMTANTTNWMGAKALITALGRHNNPRKPTFIVLQEHRNAGPDDCKRAEDWARNKGYNLSFAPAATTRLGKLHTSGGVAVGAQQHIGLTKDKFFSTTSQSTQGASMRSFATVSFPEACSLLEHTGKMDWI